MTAILGQRCPRCFEGKVFRRGITMNEHCPVCDLKFEREQGFFLGAMYVAYGMTVLILAVFATSIWLFWHGTLIQVIVATGILFAPLTPFVFRYSRVAWLHLDYLVEPW